MATPPFTYSVADDTANGAVAGDKLFDEISGSSITISLKTVHVSGDVLNIDFNADISAGEKTTLDGLITAHDGIPGPKDPQPVDIKNMALDAEGAAINRNKTTKTGWHYQPHWMEVKLGEHGHTNGDYAGIYNCDEDEADLGFTTYKIYDSNGDEITLGANKLNAVKTVVEWEPDHDYEIIASKIFQKTAPTNDIRLWVKGVPDVPYAFGGSRIFGQGGINLSMLGSGAAADTDGRSSKELAYDATNHTNKFRITIRHNAGETHKFAILWELYKS